MSRFKPDIFVKHAWDADADMLTQRGIRFVIIDIDNTLTAHGSPDVPPQARAWIDDLKAHGIHVVLLSNNNQARVEPFAQSLGVPCVWHAVKPMTRHIRRQLERYGYTPQETALIGDQLFTDIFGGNRAGLTTIKVEPYGKGHGASLGLKRKFEDRLIRKYKKEMES